MLQDSRHILIGEPSVLLQDFTILVKSIHAFAGIAIWEFLVNLRFDWEVVSGIHTRRWTFWVYLICRLAPLISACIILHAIDTPPSHCEIQLITGLFFASIAFLSSSLLIFIRTVAIWGKNRMVVLVGLVVLLANIGAIIRDYTIVEGAEIEPLAACVVTKSENVLSAYIMYLITEVSLLSLMLVGLVRAQTSRSTGLWEMLYHQGWIWLLLALVAEVPTLVLIALNLNDAMNLVLQTPAMLIMTVGATRMYRSLSISARKPYCSTAYISGSRRLQTGMASATTVRAGGSQIPDCLPKSSSTRAVEVEVNTSTEVHDGERGPGPRNGATDV